MRTQCPDFRHERHPNARLNRTGPDRTELEVATAKSPASLTLTRDPLTPPSQRLTAIGRLYRNLSTPRLGVSEGGPRGSGLFRNTTTAFLLLHPTEDAGEKETSGVPESEPYPPSS